jgi:hypothetical protein
MSKEKYALILNFESESIDVLDLVNCPDDDYEEFIEDTLEYSLSNCEWMVVNKKPEINFLN